MTMKRISARKGLLQSSMQTQVRPGPRFSSALLRLRRDRRLIGILLILIVVLGGIVFGVARLLQGGTSAPYQPSITTTTLGTTVDYAGVDVTVVNAQKSQSFLDDSNSTSSGMLRLQLQAQNKTSLTINLPYETIAHVTVPGGKPVS